MLTDKQKKFVDQYLIDMNASAAARRAGFSAATANRTASRLLSKADIQAAIAAGRAALAERAKRSVDDVMADIGRVRANAMQMLDDPETGAKVMVSHKDALKALELEGKHLGAFLERHEMTGKNGAPLQVATMHCTPAEFAQVAAEVAGKV